MSAPQWIVAIVVEHLLLLLKMLLAFFVPDTPRWVVDAQARASFQASVKHKAIRRRSTADEEHAEYLERQQALAQIDVCEGDADPRPPR